MDPVPSTSSGTRKIQIFNGGLTLVTKVKKPLYLMHSTKLVPTMSIDTYGLSTEQYQEFFEDNVRFAAELYLQTCNILTTKGVGNVDFKTVLDMYQECTYQTNDDCRRYQKANNPEAVKDDVLFELSPTRQELLLRMESVDAKIEALTDYICKLTDYINKLTEIVTAGLNGVTDALGTDQTVLD